LVTGKCFKKDIIPQEEFFSFLEKRKGILDAVVISGGEPCLNNDLAEFIEKVKEKDLLVKLDTNGSFPEALEILFEANLLDYVAMDIKSSLDNYKVLSGGFDSLKKILKSIQIIQDSNISYEFRTTVVKGMHTKKYIEKIGKLLEGSESFSIQNFNSGGTISKELDSSNEFSEQELREFEKILKKYVKRVEIKNLI
jgi:pyruvate formate lyase activating enzyme